MGKCESPVIYEYFTLKLCGRERASFALFQLYKSDVHNTRLNEKITITKYNQTGCLVTYREEITGGIK